MLDADAVLAMTNDVDKEQGMVIFFYDHTVENKHKSAEAQRPVFDDVIYVKIMASGQKRSTVDRKKRDSDEKDYPNAWAAYGANDAQRITGVPIAEWTGITRSRAAELRHMGVLSVELLAGLTDEVVGNIGPDGVSLREAAKKWLAGNEPDVVQSLKDEIAELKELIKAASAKPVKRGRPPKQEKQDEPTDSSTEHS